MNLYFSVGLSSPRSIHSDILSITLLTDNDDIFDAVVIDGNTKLRCISDDTPFVPCSGTIYTTFNDVVLSMREFLDTLRDKYDGALLIFTGYGSWLEYSIIQTYAGESLDIINYPEGFLDLSYGVKSIYNIPQISDALWLGAGAISKEESKAINDFCALHNYNSRINHLCGIRVISNKVRDHGGFAIDKENLFQLSNK